MIHKDCCILIPFEITGRNAHKIVYSTQELKSSIYFKKDNRCINAKSLIGLLSLGIKKNDIITVNFYADREDVIDDDIQNIKKIINDIGSECINE